MSETAPNFESLLREALSPVEPPADLALRLEDTLQSITELAADELQEWELSAMRDPRNWARPAAAAIAGGTAGAALVLLRARRRAQAEAKVVVSEGLAGSARERVERAVKDVSQRAHLPRSFK
jgi:hypothetical protein